MRLERDGHSDGGFRGSRILSASAGASPARDRRAPALHLDGGFRSSVITAVDPGGGTAVLLPLSSTTNPPYRARVLIAGGGGADPAALDVNTPATATAEILDLSAPALSWRTLDSPMLSRRVMPDSVLLPDGTVLIAGGSASGRANNMLAPVYELEL